MENENDEVDRFDEDFIMSPISSYSRPATLDDALRLLARPNVRARLIAGGTSFTPHLGNDVEEVIDLQAIGLDKIAVTGATATIGSMTTLQALVECAYLPVVVREAARRDAPNTFRHVATIGGAVAMGDWESELLASLLVCDAQVTMERQSGHVTTRLSDFLTARLAHLHQAVITQVTLTTDGATASDRTGRTPADKPIVAAIARRNRQGDVRLALSGVAETPVLVAPDALNTLAPPGDFRGSAEYRSHLAGVLARRVLQQI